MFCSVKKNKKKNKAQMLEKNYTYLFYISLKKFLMTRQILGFKYTLSRFYLLQVQQKHQLLSL